MRESQSSTLLSDKQRQRIQLRHKHSIERFGYSAQALLWSSKEVQFKRFEVLSQVLAEGGDTVSVLDVGCGFADLYDYLLAQGFAIDYQGIDLSADMVQSAKFQHKTIKVEQGDLFDFNPAEQSYDYILLSGALNEVVESTTEQETESSGEYAKAVIKRMYQSCRKAVAFNLLDARHEWIRSRVDLQSFKPEEIVEYCRIFADKVTWQDDYLDNDFTVFLYKD
ncbi:class I SAM-dependent methyltransferase [Thiomicrorhabdus sediminis]|uniref:Class I SAM-dependent methyltransferase n=1 Tax=Thiomicrorhabdus sediminis TaxID=2580412 RepID=A0A4P9K4U4_9GAMM|nr:class I SAM-dependent methyltransferase [Thiomicrorhabdus sediminis]QCU89979.1 class I SAM-dependent methyltransferase [Thiomicrorhabdus sediminis]